MSFDVPPPIPDDLPPDAELASWFGGSSWGVRGGLLVLAVSSFVMWGVSG